MVNLLAQIFIFSATVGTGTGVTELDLSARAEFDASSLGQFENLEKLYIDYTGLSDLRYVAPLKQLWYLEASGNKISDLSPVSDLPSLEFLALANNSITDLSPLKNHPTLKILSIAGNRINDLSPLLEIPHLSQVYVMGTNIGDNKVTIRQLRNRGVSVVTIVPYPDEIRFFDYSTEIITIILVIIVSIFALKRVLHTRARS